MKARSSRVEEVAQVPAPGAAPKATARVSVAHLMGSTREREWLVTAHRQTHLPKTIILRLALAQWGATQGLAPYPDRAGGEA